MTFMLLQFDTGSYHVEGDRDDALDILLCFLNHDVGSNGSGVTTFKEFALSEQERDTSSNVSSLEKVNGNIIIKDLFTEEGDSQPFCEIKLQNFLALLDKWAEMARKKPLYLVLVDRGHGDVSFEETYSHSGLSR